MEDKTYNTSITKKRMVFLALRKIRGPGARKLIAEVLRAFKKASNETEERTMVGSIIGPSETISGTIVLKFKVSAETSTLTTGISPRTEESYGKIGATEQVRQRSPAIGRTSAKIGVTLRTTGMTSTKSDAI
jgi:hypothetical protein